VRAGSVVGSVTTSEYPVLYVFWCFVLLHRFTLDEAHVACWNMDVLACFLTLLKAVAS
jgi:hypothetical protein